MKGDPIPETDTITRYCSYNRISELTGKPSGAAFKLRSRDMESANPHISVNWLEYFDTKDKQGQIREIRNILSKKMKVGSNAKLALLNVGALNKHFRNSDYNPRILHWPDNTETYTDPSHAGIFDIENDPDIIADMLAQVESEILPAKI